MVMPQKKRYSYNNKANRIYVVDKPDQDISYTVGVPHISYLTKQPPKIKKSTKTHKNRHKKKKKVVRKYKRKPGVRKGSHKKLHKVLAWSGPRQVSWPTYQEAKTMVRARGIKSRVQYIDWMRTNRVKYLPSNPNVVYDEWEGWAEFCGTDNEAKGIVDKTVYLSFWDAAAIVQRFGLSSGVEWRQYIKSNVLPPGVCRNPARVYKDIWNVSVGWDQWLGKDASAVVEVARKVEESKVWCIVCKGEDLNYFEVVKCGEREVVGGRVLGRWKFEKEYEDWLWKYLDSVSSEWEGKGSRVCSNVWQVIGGMDHQLLKVR